MFISWCVVNNCRLVFSVILFIVLTCNFCKMTMIVLNRQKFIFEYNTSVHPCPVPRITVVTGGLTRLLALQQSSRLLYVIMHIMYIIRWNPCSASDFAYDYTFLRDAVCLSVCLSVVCLSRLCTLLKPFNGFRCHLTGAYCVRLGPWPPWKGKFRVKHPAVELQIAAAA